MGHRPIARMRRVASLLVAVGAVGFAIPSMAAATTRFAAPGGIAPDTMCTTPATPCSIGAAAGGPDVTAADEAVIQPGHYSNADLDGDANQPMDDSVRITAGLVHGTVGDRPVITLTDSLGDGAFQIGAATTLSDIEVDALDSSAAIVQTGGIAERIVARTSQRGGSEACVVEPESVALLRDSVCFTDGEDSAALDSTFIGATGTHTVRLRNVTSSATQADSDGLFFETRGAGVNLNVDAKSVIARGGLTDVEGLGLSNINPPPPNTGGNVTVALDHSNYVTVGTRANADGVVAVTPAGTGTNQTGPVVLGADDYHQVANSGSLILDHGAVDAFSGTTDIDGQNRTIGQAPDIGADELGFPTSTSVHCSPNPIQLGMGPSRCHVTVSDTSSPPPVTFFGGVAFSSDGAGSFGDENECEAVERISATQVGCTFTYTPRATGIHHLTVSYSESSTGEAIHDPSQGSDALNVLPPPIGASPPKARSAKRCKKRHRHATAAKKKKCKKKKRR